MPVLHFTVDIEGPRETIFGFIADLTQYERWLPGSRAFDSVTQVSKIPVDQGTTYIDIGPSGKMDGSVTDFDPPTHIAFRQSMPVKLLLFAGILELHIRYALESMERTTIVRREVSFQLPGVLKLAHPVISATVRRESMRLLQHLKRYVEGPSEDKA